MLIIFGGDILPYCQGKLYGMGTSERNEEDVSGVYQWGVSGNRIRLTTPLLCVFVKAYSLEERLVEVLHEQVSFVPGMVIISGEPSTDMHFKRADESL